MYRCLQSRHNIAQRQSPLTAPLWTSRDKSYKRITRRTRPARGRLRVDRSERSEQSEQSELRDLFPHAFSQGVTAASDGKLRPLENADLPRLQGPEVSQNDTDIRTSFRFFDSTTRSYWVLSRVAVNRIRISPSTGGSTALGWGWETTWNNPWLQPWVKLSKYMS